MQDHCSKKHEKFQRPGSGGPVPRPEEKVCLAAAREGDAAALEALVDCYEPEITSLAGTLLGSREEVEDVVQEVFLKAFKRLRSFRGECSLATWLRRITINTCRDHRDQAWHQRVALVDWEEAETHDTAGAAEANSPEDHLLRAERDEILRRALAALPEKFRLPLLLRFFEGYSGKDIAAVLGCCESTVWSRIYAGLEKLRRSLQDYFGEDG
jgi:RNA polymerase sigma-70 factor (ECF subfamily)